MNCFELIETVSRGIPVRYPYLYLGHPGEDSPFPSDTTQWADARWAGWRRALEGQPTSSPYARIPLDESARAWISTELGTNPVGHRCLLERASLRHTAEGPQLHLEREARPDGLALILVRTVPGEGGAILYRHNSRVECVFQLDDPSCYTPDYACTDRLFVMSEGGLLRIERTGELEGACKEFILGWDGLWMHELHRTLRPNWRTVRATTAAVQAAPPVRRIRGGLQRLTAT